MENMWVVHSHYANYRNDVTLVFNLLSYYFTLLSLDFHQFYGCNRRSHCSRTGFPQVKHASNPFDLALQSY